MNQVDTLHVGRYWSEVLCCTITAHLVDNEVKVMDKKYCVQVFGLSFLSLYLLNMLMDSVDTLHGG